MATIEELQTFVEGNYLEYCSADQAKRVGPFTISVPFTDWEAKFFMRGLELRFFEVTCSDGLLRYDNLGGRRSGKTRRKNFFYPNGPGTGREAVTQFAAITELIEVYRYPVQNILAESVKRGESNQYALDGLVFEGSRDEVNPVRIALEAKSTASLARLLIANINSCVELGKHGIGVHSGKCEQDAHKKYRAILDWLPAYFWVVCPTNRWAYLIQYITKTSFSLAPVDDIPDFVSSNC